MSFQELLTLAIDQDRMSGLLEVLRYIAEETDSLGAILWQAAPGATVDPPSGHLFVLADWFPERLYCATRDLSMKESFTGTALRTGKQQNITQITKVKNPDSFLVQAEIKTFCATPIVFRNEFVGALNLYRRIDRPYERRTLAHARAVAEIIPILYQIISDKVSSTLIASVNRDLREFKAASPLEHAPQFERVKPTMEQICRNFSGAFNCLETSIFLQEKVLAPGTYTLAATTWPGLFNRTTYNADASDGITGWSLAHKKPVLVFDLGKCDPKAVDTSYPGMRWSDGLDLRKTVRKYTDTPKGEELPPLSMMTAPIIHGEEVVGIVRCSVGRGPIYFAEVEHGILQMMASQLGSFWGELLEDQSLSHLVARIQELNSIAYTEIARKQPDRKRIYGAVLDAVSEVIPQAAINDFRELSASKTELRFAAVQGRAWTSGTAEEVSRRRNMVYKADAGSAGAYVIQSGKPRVMHDVQSDPLYFKNFREVRAMIIAPVRINAPDEEEVNYGVLDVRSVDRAFTPYAVAAATMLGAQLALFLKLAATARERTELSETQIRINEDMAHQFRLPILTAHGRVQEALRRISTGSVDVQEVTDLLLVVRGACARAMHVSQNSGFFAQLARREKIITRREVVDKEILASMLINTGKDAALLHDQIESSDPKPSRRLWGKPRPHSRDVRKRFWVTTDGFELVEPFTTDRGLLEQAVTQLLDNAFKYSFPDSQVRVTGGYTRSTRERMRSPEEEPVIEAVAGTPLSDHKRWIRISISSEGIELSPQEARLCTDRGWQSEHAKPHVQGGSGIGLWIVQNIIRALGGQLLIKPTDRASVTEFTLLLPAD